MDAHTSLLVYVYCPLIQKLLILEEKIPDGVEGKGVLLAQSRKKALKLLNLKEYYVLLSED
jgi:hypothetical protein